MLLNCKRHIDRRGAEVNMIKFFFFFFFFQFLLHYFIYYKYRTYYYKFTISQNNEIQSCLLLSLPFLFVH